MQTTKWRWVSRMQQCWLLMLLVLLVHGNSAEFREFSGIQRKSTGKSTEHRFQFFNRGKLNCPFFISNNVSLFAIKNVLIVPGLLNKAKISGIKKSLPFPERNNSLFEKNNDVWMQKGSGIKLSRLEVKIRLIVGQRGATFRLWLLSWRFAKVSMHV